MLRKTLPILLLTLGTWLGLADSAAAQQQRRPEHTYGFRCAFDSVQQEEFRRNPGAAQEYQQFLSRVANMTPAEQARIAALPDVTVPVVMHVIHTGGANNITDAQILDAMRIINRDFNKENPDTANLDPRFSPIAARTGFQFKLAQLDPNGRCTTGITRTFSTLTSVGDNNVKDVIRWDPNRYLNIWIVDNANGAGGYAILPCGGGSTRDGIVIRNTQFGSIGRACNSNFCHRSLTHELGHHFGLPHTWGGSNTPGLPSNCNSDDGIADTPNTIGAANSGCNVNQADCGPVANVQNYMDYAACISMFTEGQKAVMRASLALSCRSTLVSAANLVATGTNPGYQGTPCPPSASFTQTATTICAGGSINFIDFSYGALTGAQYQWSFPGGTPATSTLRSPVVTYNTPGTYDVTLTVSNANGPDVVSRQQLIRVLGPNASFPAPYAESFETNTWTSNPTDPDKVWRNETNTNGADRWQRIAGVGTDGTSALRLRNPNIANGTVTSLYSPVINLTTASGGLRVSFDRAYARRLSTSSDQMRVSFSSDCGVTWSAPTNFGAALLTTNTGSQPITGNFLPTATEWANTVIDIPAGFQNTPNFVVRIEVTTNNGNNLFLDNFRIQGPLGTRSFDMASRGISVYPNPLTLETAVQFTLDKATTAQVQVQDLLGRTVLNTEAKTYSAGQQRIALGTEGKRLSPGVYVVQLTLGEDRYTSRVLVR